LTLGKQKDTKENKIDHSADTLEQSKDKIKVEEPKIIFRHSVVEASSLNKSKRFDEANKSFDKSSRSNSNDPKRKYISEDYESIREKLNT
jgi:hypothetical protein